MPRTLSGKKMELPVKKLLMGTPAEQVFKLDAMANAGVRRLVRRVRGAGAAPALANETRSFTAAAR